jgi:hypothetical protein
VRKPMQLELGSGEGLRIERLRSVARAALAFSLVTFFASVVLLGATIGDQVLAEGVASFSSLAIALSAFAYIALGLRAERVSNAASRS